MPDSTATVTTAATTNATRMVVVGNNRRRCKVVSRPTESGYPSTLYPEHPPGTRRLLRLPDAPVSLGDRLLVAGSSLFLVGSVAWVPALAAWACRKWRRIPPEDKRRRALYGALLAASIALLVAGPHRSPRFGRHWLQVKRWRLWDAWQRFVALEIVSDRRHRRPSSSSASSAGANRIHNATTAATAASGADFDSKNDQAILAFVPHGIFPFGFGIGFLPELAQRYAFGFFHPVVATASGLFPWVRDLLKWSEAVYVLCLFVVCCLGLLLLLWLLLQGYGGYGRFPHVVSRADYFSLHFVFSYRDASRDNVERALAEGKRIGLVPGGIAEIFEGYPKSSAHPDDEYAIVRRGFLRLAVKYGIPVVPIYCFGATKMFHRLELPILERISVLLRISICVFYGVCGLPIPFRQKLSYVMGDPIYPPQTTSANANGSGDGDAVAAAVGDMHERFCDELLRIFDRHKEAYGWGHKTLKLVAK